MRTASVVSYKFEIFDFLKLLSQFLFLWDKGAFDSCVVCSNCWACRSTVPKPDY